MSLLCRQVLRELSVLAEPEPRVDAVLREHTEQCPACSVRVARARAVGAALRAMPRVQIPASVTAAMVLERAIPARTQEAVGHALAAALPRLRLPETSVGPMTAAPSRGDELAAAPLVPMLREALRAPSRTPGWLWSRVRADLRVLRAQHLGLAESARAERTERSLQRWFHTGLAAAAAAVLVLWFSSTMQAKEADDAAPFTVHSESSPLMTGQMPEAIHESIQQPLFGSRPGVQGERQALPGVGR